MKTISKTRNALFGLLSGLLLLAAGNAEAQTIAWNPNVPAQPNPVIALDKADYQPGETANISGTGFLPLEAVTLQVLHGDGTPGTGDDHMPWTVNADADGNLVSTWHVCEDDCLNSVLELVAIGNTSGLRGAITFSDGFVTNGGFETGTFLGWAIVNSGTSGNNWYNYTGTVSPFSSHAITAPPQGTRAVVSDQTGPGYQVLYQDLILEPAYSHTLTFKVYYKNWHTAFVTPANLTHSVTNQQMRVDIIKPTASILSVAVADVLATPFKTNVGDPLTKAPTLITVNLSAFAGTTVRLRCAVAETIFFFNGSVDDVVLTSVPLDAPPIANAGADFSVNEGQTLVPLNGSLSSDPDGDPLTYAWVQLPGGPAVTLTGANTAGPTFTAPTVALGGETLSFDLTVIANGKTSTDTVSVTVVNVNHPPVAEAGPDQSVLNGTAVAEGSPVTLDGSASFDIDSDVFTHAWVQVSGPTVTLTGANTSGPTFTAPYAGTNGAAGVVATLVFDLLVDDGFPADAPATGYTLANVYDRVTVEITNTNNLPLANAGADQTVDENSAVALSGLASSDPDSDPLTYAWTQTGGPAVTLTGGATATPSFTAPFVSAGGVTLEFEVTVDDGYGGTATDTVVINVQNSNDPPLASAAQPTVACLWPPNHQMVAVGITGVSDPDNNATITITGVTQDEPTNGLGDGDTAIDAVINADGTVLLRAERSGKGNGRVYRISFTASDLEGSSSGMVKVCVPHSPKKPAIDSLSIFDSTN